MEAFLNLGRLIALLLDTEYWIWLARGLNFFNSVLSPPFSVLILFLSDQGVEDFLLNILP